MRTAVGYDSVWAQSWVHNADLISHLAASDLGYIHLGKDLDYVRAHYSLDILYGFSGEVRFGIGISTGGHALPPQFVIAEHEPRLIIGYEKTVAAIDVARHVMRWELSLDSFFQRIVPWSNPQGYVIEEEIGLHMVTLEGKRLWSIVKDIISDLRREGNHLIATFMDSSCVKISVADGKCEWASEAL